jgi:putative N6-adenine-specific DNA methylase
MKYTFDTTGDFEMKATTFFGLEEVLANDLLRLGAKNIEPFTRGVAFTGDLGFLYKVNFSLRTALKILVPIASFKASTEQKLYDEVKKLPWEQFITPNDTIAIESVLNSEFFSHSLFISQKAKDAIADRFREQSGIRPSVDLENPSLKIYIHIFRDEVTVGLDSSGAPLYKRGYRSDINTAPMKEVLAAGLVKLSGWQPHQLLIDGMCGSGTIAIEAALIANNIPPGYFRDDFGFKKWKNFDEKLYETIYESSISRIKNDEPKIIANDILGKTVNMARNNIQNAKVEDVIRLNNQSFFEMKPPKPTGVIILNPPYGERMKPEEITAFYKQIGDKLKKDFTGYTAWVITSSPTGMKAIGLRPTRKITVYNGALECRFLKFELYGGSKKAKKNPPAEG